MQNKYKKNTKNIVLEKMLSDIVTCRLAPGELIKEAKICTRYSASRTPVREAFIALDVKGFIHLEKNKGAVVAPLDAAMIYSIFEARIPVEKAAAALASMRGSTEEFAALSTFKDELTTLHTGDDLDSFFAIDRAVHDAISNLARNPFVAGQVKNLRLHTARCWHFYRDRGLREQADVQGLIQIIDAITTGNPKMASEAMRAHLGRYLKAYENMLVKQIEVLKWV